MRKLNFTYIILIGTFFVFIFNKQVYSQDIHFSQFWNSPINLSPSHAGNFDGDYRFTLNNKNQWLSFANAYSTLAGSVDAHFAHNRINNTSSGLGLQINSDIAGDGRLSTNQFVLSAAFSNYWLENKQIKTSYGVGLAYTFNAVNFNNFEFGSQYQNGRFEPNADHFETFQFDRIDYFSYNAGININYKVDTGLNLGLGMSVNNINQPGKSFNDDEDFYLPMRYSYFASAKYNIYKDLWIEPHFLFMQQKKYREFLIGSIFSFDYNPMTFHNFFTGIFLRTSDAAVFLIGTDYQNVKLTISYDINISKLSQVSRGRGGVEFSLIYKIFRPVPFDTPYFRKCPEFM